MNEPETVITPPPALSTLTEVELEMPKPHCTEVWKDVVGFEGAYQVSNMGRVKSLARVQCRGSGMRPYPLKERVLKPYDDHNNGYRLVILTNRSRRLVHRLVLEAFVGPCPEGMQCRHLDGNPGNNRLNNLAWGTPVENSEDRRTHGTAFNGPKGNTHPFARLDDRKVREIRRKYATGRYPLTQLRDECDGIHVMTLSNAINRVTWKHVQ